MLEKSIFPLGDRACLVTFRPEISPAVQRKVSSLEKRLKEKGMAGIVETVPAYCSLAVYYDPLSLSYDEMLFLLEKILEDDEGVAPTEDDHVRVVEIPTLYGNDCGPDLIDVARHCGLTPEEVIERHRSRDYLVYFIGFTPGFPYLGGMDKRLKTPRLEDPRLNIPAGSVGIAGEQTGIYPVDSPGGWRIIGRTPVPLYQPVKNPPTLLEAGDYVRFVQVEREVYHRLEEEVRRGSWKPRVELRRRVEVETTLA
ncbi:MAG: 5-oxoprolinase subunit PxpB [Peptococcaceae bacterium]|nr:5-oxoprolinase subunit PxpB [Peptococcaceae bacterium]